MDKVSPELSSKDVSLLNYLSRHEHWTPFAHVVLSFRITLPIFVARQLMKSTVGVVVNEVSRRYVTTPPQFLDITNFRQPAPSVKQGSSPHNTPYNLLARSIYRVITTLSNWSYWALLKLNVCPEQARSVLPQSLMTTLIWTGSLAALHRLYRLRTNDHAQLEIQNLVNTMATYAQSHFPNAWTALENTK